ITMTESKCQGNIDCREEPHKQPCPVPLACLFGSCICPWKSHSTFSPCQIKCAHSGKKSESSRRQRLAVSASMITQQMIEQGVLDCLLEEGETDDALMGILRVSNLLSSP
ncbi:hypothetical protein F2Q69_00055472, partial [Brassica cretica]